MAISLGQVFEPFVTQRPICVMARGVLENLFNAARIDALFTRTAEEQYTRELLFSSVVDLMGQVVLGVQPSVHAAYQAQAEQLGVSDQAVYDKLRHVELGVSAELVRDAARQAAPVIGALQAALPPLVPGYRTKILDGNHLAASEHRIEALRCTWAAPLPGQILVVLDQEPMLAIEVVLCEDGHAQERALLGQVLSLVNQDDLWIADRNFCTVDFLFGIAARGGCFVIRQHGQLKGTLVGARRMRGAIDSGKVYEQKIGLVNAQGDTLMLRRLTVALHEPTRDGDTEIHVLSNVPRRKASAPKLAESYGKRWTIETMFHELTETLTCEVNTLGYPKAALFGFCLALMAYNAVSVLKAALRAVHGYETVQQAISPYYLALEISQTYDGMMVAIPSPHWSLFRLLNAQQLADVLQELAAHVNLRRYKKHPRGPKKKPTERTAYKNGGHVSTVKILTKKI
jgi:DDE family transposase